MPWSFVLAFNALVSTTARPLRGYITNRLKIIKSRNRQPFLQFELALLMSKNQHRLPFLHLEEAR